MSAEHVIDQVRQDFAGLLHKVPERRFHKELHQLFVDLQDLFEDRPPYLALFERLEEAHQYWCDLSCEGDDSITDNCP